MIADLKSEFAPLAPVAIIETDYQVKGYHLDVEVGAGQVVAVAELLDRRGFFLESITGVDWLGKTPIANQVEAAGEPAAVADSEADAQDGAAEKSAEQMEVVYDYNHTGGELCRVVVRCRLERVKPEIPTICQLIPGANWHERETHDFFGIKFLGHPDLSPLLLPEDADFHPLLKDFKV
ncbi:MAG: NADH-quinone oxidoreductase subunit C [Thermodesulfobacteriota bacterium]